MLERVYTVLGSVLLLGYSVVWFEGWEFTNPTRLSPPPPVGATLSSSGHYYHSGSSGSRSGWIIWGGK
jgi:hypothetical protein